MGRSFSQGSAASIDARNRRIQTDEAIEKKHRRIETIIGIVAVVISIVIVAASFYTKIQDDKRIDALSEDIKLKAQELEQAKSREGVSDAGLVIEEDAMVNSAVEAGTAVCKLQNSLAKMTRDARKAGQNMASNDYQRALIDFRSYLGDTKDSAIKNCWCEYGQWTFDSTFAYEGTTMPVVWRCYDGEDLLAIVVANYNGSDVKFNDAQLFTTVEFTTIKESDPLIINPPVTTIPDEAEEETSSFSFKTTTRAREDEETQRTTELATAGASDGIHTDPDADTTRPVSDVSDDTTTTPAEDLPDETTTTVVTDADGNPVPVVTTTVSTTARPPVTITYLEPEEQWYYGWSSTYQCWGYFNQDGRFLTEDEYQAEFGW